MQVLETTVDHLGGSVAGDWSVEEREDVGLPLLQRGGELADLDERGRARGAQVGDQAAHDFLPRAAGRCSVGGDHPLVGTPCRLDFGMLVVREQQLQTQQLLAR